MNFSELLIEESSSFAVETQAGFYWEGLIRNLWNDDSGGYYKIQGEKDRTPGDSTRKDRKIQIKKTKSGNLNFNEAKGLLNDIKLGKNNPISFYIADVKNRILYYYNIKDTQKFYDYVLGDKNNKGYEGYVNKNGDSSSFKTIVLKLKLKLKQLAAERSNEIKKDKSNKITPLDTTNVPEIVYEKTEPYFNAIFDKTNYITRTNPSISDSSKDKQASAVDELDLKMIENKAVSNTDIARHVAKIANGCKPLLNIPEIKKLVDDMINTLNAVRKSIGFSGGSTRKPSQSASANNPNIMKYRPARTGNIINMDKLKDFAGYHKEISFDKLIAKKQFPTFVNSYLKYVSSGSNINSVKYNAFYRFLTELCGGEPQKEFDKLGININLKNDIGAISKSQKREDNNAHAFGKATDSDLKSVMNATKTVVDKVAEAPMENKYNDQYKYLFKRFQNLRNKYVKTTN